MSGDGAGGEQQDSTDERERRLAALRGLAHGGPAAAEPRPTHATQATRVAPVAGRASRSPRWRKPVAIVVALVALVAVVVGLIATHALPGSTASTHGATPGPIVPALNLLQCESAVAWAPDNRLVALVGYQRDCPQFGSEQYNYWPGYLAIYDTTTGKSVAQINLDLPIQQALHLTAPVDVTPANIIPQGSVGSQAIQYGRLAWAPDGKRLAITFYVSELTSASRRNVTGILLIGADGSAPRVLATPLSASGAQADPREEVWDLARGAPLPVNASAPIGQAFFTAGLGAAALSYHWGANGALIPSQPLPLVGQTPPTPATETVGNPAGGAQFSIWQPGQVNVIYPPGANGQAGTSTPGIPVFQTAFLAWSPDGRYLLDTSLTGVLAAPSGVTPPSAQTLTRLNFANAPALPVRDAALLNVIKLQGGSATTQQFGETSNVAWSPDGKLLAAVTGYSAKDNDPDYAQVTITLYNCATGKRLAAVVAHAAVNQTGYGNLFVNVFVSWSPDGKRLLYFNPQLGSLTTWGPGVIPQA